MNTEKLSNEAQNSPLRKGVVINWVATVDRIPEDGQEVLCFNGYRMVENSWCGCTDQDDKWFKRTFTHWTKDVLPPCL